MTLRVRHIPAGHVYVEHLQPLDGDSGVLFLADPPVPGATPGQWWPHPALEADWIARHAGEQDVVHLHFGTEGRTPAQLAEWIAALRRAGLTLVHTVHDVDHPHLRDQQRHRAHLALLVEHADTLITLTEGAADRIADSYGRRPLVIPHPHVVPLDQLSTPATPMRAPRNGNGLRIGLHLKSLRTNLAPLCVLPSLVDAVRRIRTEGVPAVLEVRAHPEVLDSGAPRFDAELADLLRAWMTVGLDGIEVVVAPRLDDAELWTYLSELDVSVLPYAWATHSGWVEACRDLGTWVLAPEVGHLAEQGGVLTWGPPGEPPCTDRLIEVLRRIRSEPAARVTAAARMAQRTHIAQVHEDIYRTLVSDRQREAGP